MAISKPQKTDIKTLSEIIANKTHFGDLIKKNQNLQQLNKLFRSILDTELSQHCQIAKFERGSMVLIVDNAGWATKLRYNIPDIIKLLNTQPEFIKLKKIRFKINSYADEPQQKSKPHKDPKTQQKARALHEMAKKLNPFVVINAKRKPRR